MNWERRKQTNEPKLSTTDLPLDYLRLVEETLTTALEPNLAAVKKLYPKVSFTAGGAVYSDEVLIAVTFSQGESDLAATTVYASADFNANSEITVELTLSACLDAVGSIFDFYLAPSSPECTEQLMTTSLSNLEEAPFEWSPLELAEENKKVVVYVKMDKSNPALDAAADKWLKDNDPNHGKEDEEAEEFLQERLDAIKAAKSGTGGSGTGSPFGGGDSGPIRH